MLLRGLMLIKFIHNAIDWNVPFVDAVVDILDGRQDVLAGVRCVVVVVLLEHVDQKGTTAWQDFLGDGLDICHSNLALDSRHILNIIQELVGKKKRPLLRQSKLVLLRYSTAEDNVLSALNIELVHHGCIICATRVIFETWVFRFFERS